MLAIHLGIFPLSAEAANQTNIIFQNATLGGKELNTIVLSQPGKKAQPQINPKPSCLLI